MDPLNKFTKMAWYIWNTKPILDKDALFSDGTKFYRMPAEPTDEDEVRVRLRTAKENVDEVWVICDDRRFQAVKVSDDERFDYYEAILPPSGQIRRYFFEVFCGNTHVYYNKIGATDQLNAYYNFQIIPNYHIPDWAKGSVFYQIFVDRFYNGDPSNDVVNREYVYVNGEPVTRVEDWNRYPSALDVRDFYGGDLQGVMDKLDYLQDLGIETIYLNPIFVSPSNHKYDCQDYDHIDPHFGKIVVDNGAPLEEWARSNFYATKYASRTGDSKNLEASDALFARLVEEIHKRGMKIVLDGVFNHCGSFNKWMDREGIYKLSGEYEPGAYESADSPYRSFFRFHDENAWPNNGSYDGWWGFDTLPKLDYENSEKLQEYVLNIAKKWLAPPYNIDGWRLDVAADLGHSSEYNHQFWKEFRKAVKSVNPDALIIAEHYGDPSSWLSGEEWDTVMNYDAFMEPFSWFFTGLEKHSNEYRHDLYNNGKSFVEAMTHNMTRMETSSLQVAMNELSNHDHSRFLTRTSHKVGRTESMGPEAANEGINKGIFREAVVAQMTWPGCPTVYYGDEAGLCGWTDPDNRRGYPWGREDQSLIQLHKDLIAIHNHSEALRVGSLKLLREEYGVIAYGRFTDKETYIVVCNNNDYPVGMDLKVWLLGVWDDTAMKVVIQTTPEGHTLDGGEYMVKGGRIYVDLPPFSSVILKA
jgi:alpha-glucosidase